MMSSKNVYVFCAKLSIFLVFNKMYQKNLKIIIHVYRICVIMTQSGPDRVKRLLYKIHFFAAHVSQTKQNPFAHNSVSK